MTPRVQLVDINQPERTANPLLRLLTGDKPASQQFPDKQDLRNREDFI